MHPRLQIILSGAGNSNGEAVASLGGSPRLAVPKCPHPEDRLLKAKASPTIWTERGAGNYWPASPPAVALLEQVQNWFLVEGGFQSFCAPFHTGGVSRLLPSFERFKPGSSRASRSHKATRSATRKALVPLQHFRGHKAILAGPPGDHGRSQVRWLRLTGPTLMDEKRQAPATSAAFGQRPPPATCLMRSGGRHIFSWGAPLSPRSPLWPPTPRAQQLAPRSSPESSSPSPHDRPDRCLEDQRDIRHDW